MLKIIQIKFVFILCDTWNLVITKDNVMHIKDYKKVDLSF